MKITKQERNGNKIVLEIEEEYSVLETHKKKVFNEAKSSLAVPGFRKGKAPQNIAKQHLNDDALAERAVQTLISDLYPEILKESKIEPIDYPNVVVKNNKKGEPFSFSLEVDVYPNVKLGKYKGIKVETENSEVTEKDMDEFISNMRERMASFIEVDSRPVKNDDVVEVEIKATLDDKILPSLTGKNIKLVVGNNQMMPGLDNEIVGMKKNDLKDIKINMPEDHPVKEASGKEVLLSVSLKKITEKVLPDLTDDFVKQMANAESLEAFKDGLKKRLAESKKAKNESEMRNKLIEEASKNISAEIPEGMIRRETDQMIEDLKASLFRDRLTFEDYLKMMRKTEADVRKEFSAGAEARVKSKLALRAIAETENLEVSGEDLGTELKSLGKSSGEEADKFEEKIGEGGLEYIKDYLLRRKALDFLVENAKISEKK